MLEGQYSSMEGSRVADSQEEKQATIGPANDQNGSQSPAVGGPNGVIAFKGLLDEPSSLFNKVSISMMHTKTRRTRQIYHQERGLPRSIINRTVWLVANSMKSGRP